MPGFWVGGRGSHGHNGVENSQGDGLFPLDWGICDIVGFELSGKVLVQDSVSFGVSIFMESDRPFRKWVTVISPHA